MQELTLHHYNTIKYDQIHKICDSTLHFTHTILVYHQHNQIIHILNYIYENRSSDPDVVSDYTKAYVKILL